MEVNKIGNIGNPYKGGYDQKSVNDSQTDSKPSDKLEISSEARNLQSKNVSAKDFAAIKEKIDTNFYNTDKVISKVADEILKSMG